MFQYYTPKTEPLFQEKIRALELVLNNVPGCFFVNQQIADNIAHVFQMGNEVVWTGISAGIHRTTCAAQITGNRNGDRALPERKFTQTSYT